jgi:hypothetical protein
MRSGEAVFDTRWRGNAVIAIEPEGKYQPSYAGREGRKPWVPKHTPERALDPLFMRTP